MKKLLLALVLILCIAYNSLGQDSVNNKKIEQTIGFNMSVNPECVGGGIEYNIGKRLGQYFVLGGGINAHIRNTQGCVIPLYANFKTHFPLASSKIMPIVAYQLGGALVFWDEMSDPALYTSLLGGIQIQKVSIVIGFDLLSDCWSYTEMCFKFGVGYIF